MAKIEVKNLDGAKVGDVDLEDAVFGAEINEHLLWEVVKAQRAKRRAGTHSTLRRDEVRGGGKKPFKQKGTGNARQGSTRAPHFVGGGRVFTPKPRDYEYHMPKKAMAGALRSALSLRQKEAQLFVVDSFELSAAKTKSVIAALGKLGAASALIVDNKNEKLAQSTRNLPHAKYLAHEGINVYDILDYPALILTKGTVERLNHRLHPERVKGEGHAEHDKHEEKSAKPAKKVKAAAAAEISASEKSKKTVKPAKADKAAKPAKKAVKKEGAE